MISSCNLPNGFALLWERGLHRFVKYLSKAAGVGEIQAHYNLSIMYQQGRDAEKDVEKETFHLEEAAIGGHPNARKQSWLSRLEKWPDRKGSETLDHCC